ncbi:MAG: pyridoxal-phosphate dependent enzyme [Bacteroidales bacterium]|jgi:threonine synthase|nr:pyridoxal-phosphate dependent enzyme [Bacteroidales bacterium]
MNKSKYIYRCTDCGMEYDSAATMYLCPSCCKSQLHDEPPRGVLKTIYDYNEVRNRVLSFEGLREKGFIDLLPVETIASLPSLRVGNTPLYHVTELGGERIPFGLYLKDDSQNPTWSFKDRASALVSAYAVEKGYGTIIAASTGNAGSSLAGICAAQRQKAVIVVPETAPQAKLTQIIMYGATIVPVKGTYDEAFDLSVKATETFGWYNRNTAFNPLTIEGKKTASFELYYQLHHSVPDRIFIASGDGVILSGICKGFEDLLHLGIIERMPVIVAVQSDKSDNLVRNIGPDKFHIIPSTTLADSISVDIPRNFHMARQFIRQYHGETLTVTDDAILSASGLLSANTGLFAEPAAAAAFAGFLSYYRDGILQPESSNVVLLTGSGLKDPAAVAPLTGMPPSVYPSLENLERLLR